MKFTLEVSLHIKSVAKTRQRVSTSTSAKRAGNTNMKFKPRTCVTGKMFLLLLNKKNWEFNLMQCEIQTLVLHVDFIFFSL
jgi:hypothetical protein